MKERRDLERLGFHMVRYYGLCSHDKALIGYIFIISLNVLQYFM
jgi:hypothetical protein